LIKKMVVGNGAMMILALRCSETNLYNDCAQSKDNEKRIQMCEWLNAGKNSNGSWPCSA
jgi:hypothetical protein